MFFLMTKNLNNVLTTKLQSRLSYLRLINCLFFKVMLLKNISVSSGLVNGARGVIKEFRNGVPVVQFRNKKEYTAQREQWIVKTSG